MKRAQVAALIAGAALGLAGVTVALVLSRKENRETAIRLAQRSTELRTKGTKAASELAAQGSKLAGDWAEQARRLGGDVAKQAVEQYQAQAPRAVETLNTLLPRLGVGKPEPAGIEN